MSAFVWKYAFQEPNTEAPDLDYPFMSHQEAKDSAIWTALHRRRRGRKMVQYPDKKQTQRLWRSLRRSGWRIRRKMMKIED